MLQASCYSRRPERGCTASAVRTPHLHRIRAARQRGAAGAAAQRAQRLQQLALRPEPLVHCSRQGQQSAPCSKGLEYQPPVPDGASPAVECTFHTAARSCITFAHVPCHNHNRQRHPPVRASSSCCLASSSTGRLLSKKYDSSSGLPSNSRAWGAGGRSRRYRHRGRRGSPRAGVVKPGRSATKQALAVL